MTNKDSEDIKPIPILLKIKDYLLKHSLFTPFPGVNKVRRKEIM